MKVQQAYAAAELIVSELLQSENIYLFEATQESAEANAIATKAINERRALFDEPRRKTLIEDIAKFLISFWGIPKSFQMGDGVEVLGMVEMQGEVPSARFYEFGDVDCVTVVINSCDEEVRPGDLSKLLLKHGFGSRPNTQDLRIGWIGMPNFNLNIHRDGTILYTKYDNDRHFIRGSERFIDYEGAPAFSQKRTILVEDTDFKNMGEETYIVCPTAKVLYARLQPGQQIPKIREGQPTGEMLIAEKGWKDLILLRPGCYVDGLQPTEIMKSLTTGKILDLTCLYGSDDWQNYGIPDSPKYSACGSLSPRPTLAYIAHTDTIIYLDTENLGTEKLELSAGDYLVPRYTYYDGLASPQLKTLKPEEIKELGFVQCSKEGQIKDGGKPKISLRPDGPPSQII